MPNLRQFLPELSSFIPGLAAVLLLVSILTADYLDPTFFNQLYPSSGISNWMGLMGSLIGGSLLEIFGPAAVLFAWLLFRIPLQRPRRINTVTNIYYSVVLVFLLSVLQETATVLGYWNLQQDFFWQNGYSGKLALIWMDNSIGVIPGLVTSLFLLMLALHRLTPVLTPIPLVRRMISDINKMKRTLILRYLQPKPSSEQQNNPLPPFKGRSKIKQSNAKVF